MEGLIECFPDSVEAKAAVFALANSGKGICRDSAYNCVILLPLDNDEKFRAIYAGLESDFTKTPRSLARYFRTTKTFEILVSLFKESDPDDFNVRDTVCIELARGFKTYPETSSLIRGYIGEKEGISVSDEYFLQPNTLKRVLTI